MSYLISAVIEQPKEGQIEIPFIFIGGFDGLNWHMANKKPGSRGELKKLNKAVSKYIKESPDGTTTLEQLKTAPLDEVIIITGEETYKSMEDRKPLDCSKDSPNYGTKVDEYLKIKQ